MKPLPLFVATRFVCKNCGGRLSIGQVKQGISRCRRCAKIDKEVSKLLKSGQKEEALLMALFG